MIRVLIIDQDLKNNKLLGEIFPADEDFSIRIVETMGSALEYLSGKPEETAKYEKANEIAKKADSLLKGKEEEFNELDKKAAHLETHLKEVSKKSEKIETDIVTLESGQTLESEEGEQENIQNPEQQIFHLKNILNEYQENKKELEKEVDEIYKLIADSKSIVEKGKLFLQEKIKIAKELYENLTPQDQLVFNVVLIDSTYVTSDCATFIEELFEKISKEENKGISVFIMGYSENLSVVKKFLVPRVADYLVKPLDRPIVRQNLNRHLALNKPDELYSQNVSATIEVTMEAEVEQMGEFGMVVVSDRQFQLGKIVSFYGDMFGTGNDRRVLAKCLRSDEDPNESTNFISEFQFVGLSPSTIKQIRTWIRGVYVKERIDEDAA